MTKPIKFLSVAILLMLALVIAPDSRAASVDLLKEAIQAKTKSLQEINNQILAVQRQLELKQGEKSTLEKELKKLQYTASQLDLSIKASQISIEKLGLELGSLRSDIDKTQSSIGIKRSSVLQLVREMAERARSGLLLALLQNKNLSQAVAKSQTIKSLNGQLALEVVSLKELNSKLDGQFKQTNSKKQEIEYENKNLKNRRSILENVKTEQQTLLAQTKNQEKLYQQQLTDLEKKQAGISDEIDVIEDELRKNFDPTLLPVKRPGVLAWPVRSPIITQKYGEVSYLYRGKAHNGMDLGMPIGTEIVAADDGEIMAVGNNGRYQYGKYVLIKHPNSLVTLYAHLSNNLIVKAGQQVERGQLIGYSGNTGYTVGRGHLHLGLYWEPSVRLENFPACNCGLVPIGITLNPQDYL
ncbi:MAG: Peptidase, M23/M37 family [Parcubacteria group bacterium Gr01-1014_3]|nr:MAG: Peptidase, M23/M37 family [Parcubacteria group bacterium Gr01-1014_3]